MRTKLHEIATLGKLLHSYKMHLEKHNLDEGGRESRNVIIEEINSMRAVIDDLSEDKLNEIRKEEESIGS